MIEIKPRITHPADVFWSAVAIAWVGVFRIINVFDRRRATD